MNERITAVLEAVRELVNKVTQVRSFIPNQASAANQLADKAFVNSSISTANADYRGTFDDLETLQSAFGNKNDYAYYRHTDSAGNVVYDRYKYVGVPDSRLPDEYQEVESINGTVGSAYIDTGIKIEPHMHLKLKFKSSYFGWAGDFDFFGAQTSTKKYGLKHNTYTYKVDIYKGGNGVAIPGISSTEYNELEILPSGAVLLNRTFLFNITEENINDFNDLSVYMNAMNGQSTYRISLMDWNKLQISSSDETPKAMYVPCYRKSDYVTGMYDLVTDTFKPSDGTAPFNYTELSTDKWKIDTEYHDHSKQDIPQVVTSGTILTLANNTEYYLNIANGDTCTYTLPSGRYECYMRLKIAENAEMSITFTPATGETLKYIGNAPEFAAGEEWEISIKDGVIASAKVGDGT